jgi:hypothetical protein
VQGTESTGGFGFKTAENMYIAGGGIIALSATPR